jgi:hypothetical protein
MIVECQKICPLLHKICEQENCGWWNIIEKDCSINTIAYALKNKNSSINGQINFAKTDGNFR